MAAPKILAFAGSAREKSWNKKLVRLGADAARAAGAEVTLIDLRDFPMALMDEDLEAREGLPPNAKKLKELFLAHTGLLISSPEYNGSHPPLLKNALDWLSRPVKGERPYHAFVGKGAALYCATPSAIGGNRMLPQLRVLLSILQVQVIPEQLGLAHADKAFGADGKLADAAVQKKAEGVAEALVGFLKKYSA